MKSILIINSNKEQNYYIRFLLEGITDQEVNIRESLNETLKTQENLIVESSILIVEYDIKGFHDFLEYIKNNSKIIQVLVTYKTSQEERVISDLQKLPQIQKYDIETSQIGNFEKSILTLLKFDKRINKKENFCRVKMDYFLNLDSIICDVFIQISDDKYLKIINRHEKYVSEDILKYRRKGINHLYIKENDFKLFTAGMIREIQTLKLNKMPIKQQEINTIPISCIETVHEMVNKIGLTSQALILTNESINQTLGLVKKSPIIKLLKSTLGSGSYISELSLLSNYISCAICRETEWASPENYLRLSLAAFFQNISLDNDDHAKIEKLSSFEFESLPNRAKKIITDHPNKSCELISAIDGLPIGVDKIIKTHHEKYDGSGFPRGIDHSKQEALSVIFIVSLELANILFEIGFNRDAILDTITRMEHDYSKSFYPKVIFAMKKAFAVPLIEYESDTY